MGDEPLAEQCVGRFLDLMLGGAELDAARLAAPARMDLRLDDPFAAADVTRAIGRLLGTVSEAAGRHRDPETRQYFLRLIFVNIHDQAAFASCAGWVRWKCSMAAATPLPTVKGTFWSRKVSSTPESAVSTISSLRSPRWPMRKTRPATFESPTPS